MCRHACYAFIASFFVEVSTHFGFKARAGSKFSVLKVVTWRNSSDEIVSKGIPNGCVGSNLTMAMTTRPLLPYCPCRNGTLSGDWPLVKSQIVLWVAMIRYGFITWWWDVWCNHCENRNIWHITNIIDVLWSINFGICFMELVTTHTKHISCYLRSVCSTWWRHQRETFSTLLALCEGNPPVTGDAELWGFIWSAPEQTIK